MSKFLAESMGEPNGRLLALFLLERGVLGMAGRIREVGVLEGTMEGR